MSNEQQYEYKTVEVPVFVRHDIEPIQPVLDEHATDGWRLKETLEMDGTTSALVFERPVANAP